VDDEVERERQARRRDAPRRGELLGMAIGIPTDVVGGLRA